MKLLNAKKNRFVLMKKLRIVFFSFLFTSATWCGAQTMTLNLITPVCPNSTGSVQLSFMGVSYPFTLYWNGSNIQQGSVVITSSPQTVSIVGVGYGYGGSGGTMAYFSNSLKYFGAFPVGITYDPFQSLNINCAGGTVDIKNITGGSSPYTIKIEDNQTGLGIDSGASPLNVKYNAICSLGYANMRILITDATGCYSSIDSLYVKCQGLNVQSVVTPAGCTNGTAKIVSVSGGVKPYTYLWKNGATSTQITGLSKGNYNCKVADSNGCAHEAYIDVPQNPFINVNVTSSPATCAFADGTGTAFAAGGTAPYTYLWDNSATTQSTKLAGGTHSVTITDAKGCIGNGYVFVNTTSPVNVTYTSTKSSCTSSTGSSTLTVSGGTTPYTYKWHNNSSTTSTISNMPQGFYSFLVKDAVGCERTGSVQIDPVSTINASAYLSHAVCPNTTGSASIGVSGTAPPYTYLWSNSNTTNSISNVALGAYACLIKDANQCQVTRNVYIGQESPVRVGIQSTIASCIFTADGSALATAYGGTAPYKYEWSNGTKNYKASNLETGHYYVMVKDANGCAGYHYVKVDYDPGGTSCFCTIKGKVYNDVNGNCTPDAGENGIFGVMINSNGAGYACTNRNGDYSFKVKSGIYAIEQVLPPYTKLANCQQSKVVINASASSTCVHTVDFADSQTMYHDIQIFTSTKIPPIPGNNHIQKLVVTNNGNYTETGIEARYIHDGVLNYNKSNPSSLVAANSSFPNDYSLSTPLSLAAGADVTYTLGFYTPTNLPLGTIMYMVDSAAHKSPIHNYWITDEETPWNNRNDLYPICVSSYDPNYKEVFPRGEGEEGIIDLDVKSFRYAIHFENNGTANAQKVVVIDTLDADLDIESFRPVYSSHKMEVHIGTNRVVTFTFNNINLEYTPVGTYNPFAQGMLAFTINAKASSIKEGTRLASNAGIYFDYNAPVHTNTPENNYVKSSSVDQVQRVKEGQVSVYPNPTGNILNIALPETFGTSQHLEIFNMQGQVVMVKDIAGMNLAQLNVEGLDQGIYYIRVTSENGQVSGVKFIKN